MDNESTSEVNAILGFFLLNSNRLVTFSNIYGIGTV